jgi:hypothetical protein
MRSNLVSRVAKLEKTAPADELWPLIVVVNHDDTILDGPWKGRPLAELKAAWPKDRPQWFGPQVIVGIDPLAVLGVSQ